MKKLGLFSVVVVFFVFVSNFSFATGSRSEFKTFSITAVDDIFMGKKVEAIWTISYSKDEVPVTVVKRNTVEGTEYVIHSKYFDVSYLSSSKGFGTKEVKNSWRNVPKEITNAVISEEELKKQQIITPNKVDDKMALDLIASYLPNLLNDGYTHLLN
ncbi:MAG: hypothetical protein R2757_17200 [Draconibacterium sp.]|jgi:hypothetical protein